MSPRSSTTKYSSGFSALQRAEIAEIQRRRVLAASPSSLSFSALQRAEIAEIEFKGERVGVLSKFQCSSTSRNC